MALVIKSAFISCNSVDIKDRYKNTSDSYGNRA